MKNLFHIKPAGDLGSENEMELISSKKGTLPYMAGAMRDYAESSKISDEWIQAMRWYGEHDRRDFDLVAGGLLFSNRLESIGQDLADALNTGKVAAAGLDVVSSEPIRGDNPLLGAKNCFITPHISWAARESRQRIMDMSEENLRAYAAGKPIRVVNGI